MKLHISKAKTTDGKRLHRLDRITGMKRESELPDEYLASVPHCYYECVSCVEGLVIRTKHESIYIELGCFLNPNKLNGIIHMLKQCKTAYNKTKMIESGTIKI